MYLDGALAFRIRFVKLVVGSVGKISSIPPISHRAHRARIKEGERDPGLFLCGAIKRAPPSLEGERRHSLIHSLSLMWRFCLAVKSSPLLSLQRGKGEMVE